MPDEQPTTSGGDASGETKQDAFFTHQVSKLDTLAGLAVKYNISVSDIKRSNGLLSDTAMFAKDTLLIPTRAMPPIGVEYSTWAGMIVTQYGRLPGNDAGAALTGRPPQQSTAVDQLQRYYGTGDTASEPGDFKPGQADERSSLLQRLGLAEASRSSSIEIEMTNFEQHSPSAGQPGVEYAGSRDGPSDERLRRRRAGEAWSPQREDLGGGAVEDTASSPPLPCSTVPSSAARPPLARNSAAGADPWRRSGGFDAGANGFPAGPARSISAGATGRGGSGGGSGGGGGNGSGGRKRDSLLEKLKRVASQPSLAIAGVPRMVKAAGGAIAPALGGVGAGLGLGPAGSAPASRTGSADGDRLAAGATLLTSALAKETVKKD
ncbi:hypothetical protein WJX81_002611 [Elliptochloris bilobata]|uniref:LysM domain-containing protein n=1 Tax=Elliptochloris bilobata TaxID=381761 RepID=A0AAW1S1H9_9CHLO